MTVSLCCEVYAWGCVCGVGGGVVCGVCGGDIKLHAHMKLTLYMYTARFYSTVHVGVKSADSALTVCLFVLSSSEVILGLLMFTTY